MDFSVTLIFALADLVSLTSKRIMALIFCSFAHDNWVNARRPTGRVGYFERAIFALIGAAILLSTSTDGSIAEEEFRAKPVGPVAHLVKSTESIVLEPGVRFASYVIKPQSAPEHTVWIYLPEPLPSGTMPLVVVPPAGGNLISAPELGKGDRPEHLPYVRSGFAVLSFSLYGKAPATDDPLDLLTATQAFQDGEAGIANARSALNFAVDRLPIDANRIYAAGHSSAGTLVLLLAALEPRIRAVAAYAPVTDVKAGFDPETVAVIDNVLPGFAKFIEFSSPATLAAKLRVPVFLFHSKSDQSVAYQETKKFVELLSQTNRQVKFITAQRGDHYNSMIKAGIPAGLKWMEFLADR